MRKNFGAQPILYPQPVFMLGTYNDDGSVDAMAAAWGGVADEDKIFMCISAEHRTTRNILARKAFTVSMATVDKLVECDYLVIVSGDKEPDKFNIAGLHAAKSEFVDAPVIEELPMGLECELISYDPESCALFGRIVNVYADESVLNADGKIDPMKIRPITYDGVDFNYYVLGEKVGKAFHDGGKLLKK